DVCSSDLVVAVDVAEPDEAYRAYVARTRTPFPVLHDDDGAVSLSFTPKGAAPGVDNRKLVVVTSNLVIDREGKIRFFTLLDTTQDRKSTRLNSSHGSISYAVFCLKKKNKSNNKPP